MQNWNQDRVTQAWNFAAQAHQGQRVPGTEIAYLRHIGTVTMEAMAAASGVENPDLLVQCAILHDVVEDTPVSLGEIESQFGREVARGVAALTKDKTLPTKSQQMADSLTRIRQCPREIWMVKLADRISNLQPPPSHWSPEKISAYREEAEQILGALGAASSILARRLAGKIAEYDSGAV